jgi:DNA-binding MarR family transcriptional regulator
MSSDVENLDLPSLERFLTYRLHRVNKLSDRDTHRAYLEKFDMPLGEARCLAAIGRFEPLSVNDVARSANLDKGHASRSTQALVERGLVRKEVSPQDGRSWVLETTPEGKQQYRQVIALIAERNQEIFGCLTMDERAQLACMLDRIIAAQDDGALPSDLDRLQA